MVDIWNWNFTSFGSRRRINTSYVRSPYLVERRRVAGAERGGDDLGDSGVGGPGEAVGLPLAQLAHGEVTTLAVEAVVGDDRPHPLAVGQSGEIAVAEGRAQLNRIDADILQRGEQRGKVALPDHRPVWPGLTADRQSERIGAQGGDTGGGEPPGHDDAAGRRLDELSSGQRCHAYSSRVRRRVAHRRPAV
jgi:hypothetical protein